MKNAQNHRTPVSVRSEPVEDPKALKAKMALKANRSTLFRRCACAALFSFAPLLIATAHAEPFPEMELGMGMYRIEAEVAASEEAREQGLMFREKMAANHGMLFVFSAPAQVCMWMKNTLLPLSVAFLDDHGAIVNIEEMQAKTLNNHCSAKPIRFALEMNTAWFSQRGFGPGAQLRGLERAPLAR